MTQREMTEHRIIGLMGVGLDCQDGHKRITKTADFLLLGGSEDTHQRMQEVAIRFEESLEKRGKSLIEAEVDEVVDLLHEAHEGV